MVISKFKKIDLSFVFNMILIKISNLNNIN